MKRIPMVVAALLAASTAPALAAMSDQEFVTQAANGGLYEFNSGLFATTSAPDPRVQALAHAIVKDHTDLNARLNVAAERDRLRLPFMMDEKHDAMVLQMQSAQLRNPGEAQQMFLSQQKTAHDQAIALYERYAQEGTNPRLKHFAEASLPTLREHQKAVYRLSGSR